MVGVAATVGAGLAVGVLFIFLISIAAFLSPDKVCHNPSNGDLTRYDLTRWVDFSDRIVIGKVVAVKTKVVDESYTSANLVNSDTGKPVYIRQTSRYQFATIEVEKYLKDGSGSDMDRITIKDRFASSASCYSYGQRAVFFIPRTDDDIPLFLGHSSKFIINETDGTVQSQYLENEGVPPQSLADFENEIKQMIANTQ